MAENDDLAKLLSGMANGEFPQEEPHTDAHHDEPVTPAPAKAAPPEPAQTPAQPPARPATPASKAPPPPAAVIVSRRPATPQPAPVQQAPAACARPSTPQQAMAEILPSPPARSAAPQRPATPELPDVETHAHEPTPAAAEALPPDDEPSFSPEVAAAASTQLPYQSKTRPARLPARQHFVQSLWYKQTLVPVLLTIPAICLAVVILGFLSSEESAFHIFRKLAFFIPVLCIAVILLALAILTMLQIKHQLARQRGA